MKDDHLVKNRILADKDEKDEAASEEVDTSNYPEDKLRRCYTFHIPMVSMNKIVDTLKYPHDAHHNKQLGVQHLK